MAASWSGIDVNPAELHRLLTDLYTLRQRLAVLAKANPLLLLAGQRIAVLQSEFLDDLLNAGVLGAQRFDQEAKALLRQRIVRPPTGNSPGLVDLISSAPLVAPPLQYGIDYGLLDLLNSGVNRGQSSASPYWWSQEYGSSLNVGRIIHGAFFNSGGGAVLPPSPFEFRNQALFAPGVFQGYSGFGKIGRAIQPKWFLRDAKVTANALYRRSVVTAAVSAANKLKVAI